MIILTKLINLFNGMNCRKINYMNTPSAEFSISRKEINRRRKASLVLVIFLVIGFFVGSLILLKIMFFTALLYVALFFIVLIILRELALNPFKKFLQTKIIFSDEYFENNNEKIPYRDIKTINILKTTRHEIRDVVLILNNGRQIIFNAVENFDQFLEQLLVRANKKINKDSREPLDYDHPLFYVFLGFVVGFASAAAVFFITQLQDNTMAIVSYVFAVYLVIMGVYFILARPLSKRYTGRTGLGEIICGVVSISIGIIIFLINK